MKILITLLVLSPALLHATEDSRGLSIPVYRTSTLLDETLTNTEAVYEFEFHAYSGILQASEVQYSIDGVIGKRISENGTITIPSTPGKHIFQFYVDNRFYEVYTDSLEIKAGFRDTYRVQLQSAIIQVEAAKPVIYLYPERPTTVSVVMDIHGDNIFLYPSYNQGWKCLAQPNGNLIFDDKVYNYLFWEATHTRLLTPKQTATGFFVAGKDAVTFLEEKLTLAGLNSKEQADFITYWAPRLIKNELNFIHFDFNDECNAYATIDITPTPSNIYRIYMVWGAISERFNAPEQEIQIMNRSGFSVIEWGGQESHIRQSFLNKI